MSRKFSCYHLAICLSTGSHKTPPLLSTRTSVDQFPGKVTHQDVRPRTSPQWLSRQPTHDFLIQPVKTHFLASIQNLGYRPVIGQAGIKQPAYPVTPGSPWTELRSTQILSHLRSLSLSLSPSTPTQKLQNTQQPLVKDHTTITCTKWPQPRVTDG